MPVPHYTTILLTAPQILKRGNVALADLSEAIRDGTVATAFPSLSQLRKYVQSTTRWPIKVLRRRTDFLKKMLRELFRYRAN